MPLLKRSAFALAEVPDDIKPNEYVFQVRYTKEIFRDYQEYLKRINLYRQKVWACKVTGKANLTYEQALLSESKASEQVQNFPKEFVGPILRMVQFSPLCVSDLVDRIYKKFKDHFVEGEVVEGVCDGSVVPCKIIKVEQDEDSESESESCSCTYEVSWLKGDGKTTRESGESLRRRKHPLTKALVKSFIRESAFIGVSKTSRWAVHDKLARMYNIPLTPTDDEEEDEDGSDLHVLEDGGFNVHKRTKRRSVNVMEEDDGVGSECSRSAKRRRTNGRSEEDLNLPVPRRIKYPIDDSLLPASEDDSRPVPCSDFILPLECVGKVLVVWDFCCSFGKALQLSPFSLDDFEKALCYQDGEPVLLAESHHALLKAAMSDSSLSEKFQHKRKRRPEMSLDTWKDDLSDVLDIKASEKTKSFSSSVRLGDYVDLAPVDKLEILHDLTEWTVGSSTIRGQLDEHIPKRRSESGKDSKRKKVSIESLLEENEDDEPEAREQPIGANGAFKGSKMLKTFKRKKKAGVHEKIGRPKEEEHLDQEREKCPLRNIFLGSDRDFNRYWFFLREGRIFIESNDSNKWSFYSDKEELDEFYNSLNPKGVREKALKEQIDQHYDTISNAFHKRTKEFALKAAMEEAALRRSGRVKSSPRPPGFLLYVNKYRTG